jgi:3-oxoacyl-[acyl-carrier-protein] synthase II
MTVYIKGAAVLSPQDTFNSQHISDEVALHSGVTQLRCMEPPYRDYIDPMVARRMSRIVKMGVCSALRCMKDTGVNMPDAIIAGTGLGCLEDTGKFLTSIYTNEERLLNPTPFIQSTHNTIAGAIALAVKCHGYNATYTHRGFSFESALQDALMQLCDHPSMNILTGGFDELTDISYAITRRLGLWKSGTMDNTSLYQNHSRGTLPGEGVAFFMLSGTHDDQDMAVLKSMTAFFIPERDEVKTHIQAFLESNHISVDSIDLVLLGMNGDSITDGFYKDQMNGIFNNIPCVGYKHLCGEYDTSSSFAMWMAAGILKSQHTPEHAMLKGKKPETVNRILIYNHLRGKNHAMFLLEVC